MKTVLMLMVVGLAAVVLAEKYTSKYDNFDIDALLQNDRLFRKYFECAIGRARCTREGETVKQYLPEAVQTKCAKCTEKQREASEKVIKVLINKYPPLWKELNDKYDPSGKYKAEYEAEARAGQIKFG